MRPGQGGTEVEDRLSYLSPFTFTWEQGARRPHVTAPEPQAPELQVNRKWDSVPLWEEAICSSCCHSRGEDFTLSCDPWAAGPARSPTLQQLGWGPAFRGL